MQMSSVTVWNTGEVKKNVKYLRTPLEQLGMSHQKNDFLISRSSSDHANFSKFEYDLCELMHEQKTSNVRYYIYY